MQINSNRNLEDGRVGRDDRGAGAQAFGVIVMAALKPTIWAVAPQTSGMPDCDRATAMAKRGLRRCYFTLIQQSRGMLVLYALTGA